MLWVICNVKKVKIYSVLLENHNLISLHPHNKILDKPILIIKALYCGITAKAGECHLILSNKQQVVHLLKANLNSWFLGRHFCFCYGDVYLQAFCRLFKYNYWQTGYNISCATYGAHLQPDLKFSNCYIRRTDVCWARTALQRSRVLFLSPMYQFRFINRNSLIMLAGVHCLNNHT